MTGTSFDGIDLAYIQSDGINQISRIKSDYLPYNQHLRYKIRQIMENSTTLQQIKELEQELTTLHCNLVTDFIAKYNISDIDLIGMHGQTIYHDASRQLTWQLGNPQQLATKTGIKVIADFRNKDLLNGGQGAPLVPIYHYHLFHQLQSPFVIVNIGGICNISYCDVAKQQLLASDVCFGNAPFDDFMHNHFNLAFDNNGDITKNGRVNYDLCLMLVNSVDTKFPKSFDRYDFANLIKNLQHQVEKSDLLANLAHIIALFLQKSFAFLPEKPKHIIVCGGGRKNLGIMQAIKSLHNNLFIAEDFNLDGDSIEAEAFAFLAIRSYLGLPLSFAQTTGLKNIAQCSGGVLFTP